MDPVAHTLVGAVLAETGLKRVSRYATATLLIGVNLPDIDGIAKFWGPDASLYFRRGWSHGILALVVLPLLLAGIVWLWNRWRNHSADDQTPFHAGRIVLLSYLAVLTHPILDWMNTYGVRLLMPFDGRWFYGDTLFIIDPWIWLVLAAGVFLARRANRVELSFWIVVAALSSWLILITDQSNTWILLTWFSGLALIVILRIKRSTRNAMPTFARVSLAMVTLYICTLYGVARVTENLLTDQYERPLQVQANPMPGRPFSHRVILEYKDFYRVVDSHGQDYMVPREEPNQIVKAAMRSDSIRGFISWMRFPYWDVEETADGWQVSFYDLRYQGPGSRSASIGYAQVIVPFTKVLIE